MPQQANKILPAPIMAANTILSALEGEEKLRLKKLLPSYALKLAKSGVNVTIALLHDHLDKGMISLTKQTAHREKEAASYQSTVRDLAKPEASNEFEAPTLEFRHHAKKGNIVEIDRLIKLYQGVKIEGWGENSISYSELIEPAFETGNLAMLKHALKQDQSIQKWTILSEAGRAMTEGHMHMLRFVKEEKHLDLEEKYRESPYSRYAINAIESGHIDIAKYVLPTLFQTKFKGHEKLLFEMFKGAIKAENLDNMKLFIEMGALEVINTTDTFDIIQIINGANETFDYLIENEQAVFTADLLKKIYKYGGISDHKTQSIKRQLARTDDTVSYSLKEKFDRLTAVYYNAKEGRYIKAGQQAISLGIPNFLLNLNIKRGISHGEHWRKMNGSIPNHISDYNPRLLKKSAYQEITAMMEQEGMNGDVAKRYAYNAAALFRTTDRVLTYLQRWGTAGKQPLHDVIQMIEVPNCDEFNAKEWGDAVLQHGPKMAKLVTYADKILTPLKSADGKTYSYSQTKKETAKFHYKNAAKNLDLAVLCRTHNWKESHFNTGLHLTQKYNKLFKSNGGKKREGLPDISITGEEFDLAGYNFRKLPDGDIRGLALGELTNCCQHLANAGAECAAHGFVSKHGGFYVVEDKDQNIIGQSWGWKGTTGELTLDSLESLKGRLNTTNWMKICEVFAQKAAQSETAISAIHIGKGGATPALDFANASALAQPVDYKGYRDSDKEQYLVWTRDALPSPRA
jgi:hypothetical protein